jgi:hypothetical protein
MQQKKLFLYEALAVAAMAFADGEFVGDSLLKFWPQDQSQVPSWATMLLIACVCIAALLGTMVTVTSLGAFTGKFLRQWQNNPQSARYFDLGGDSEVLLLSFGAICSALACGAFRHHLGEFLAVVLLAIAILPVFLQINEFARSSKNVPGE